MRFPGNAILKAVYAHLTADVNVTASVFDFASAETPLPAITIALDGPAGAITKGGKLTQVELVVEVFSAALGYEEANRLLEEVYGSLFSAVLDLSADNFSAAAPIYDGEAFQLFAELDPTNRPIRRGVIGFQYSILDTL